MAGSCCCTAETTQHCKAVIDQLKQECKKREEEESVRESKELIIPKGESVQDESVQKKMKAKSWGKHCNSEKFHNLELFC